MYKLNEKDHLIKIKYRSERLEFILPHSRENRTIKGDC